MELQFMRRCFDLAVNGLGYVAPNPMVGAVIVHNGCIIGEGFHRQYGGAHAEVNAIASVADKEILRQSTLYVNLEPCSHYGKTPPCADLIIRCGIPRVVIASEDPNPLVAGNGIRKLREAGVAVTVGVGDEEHRFLNRRFYCFQELKRPYVILKWAQSADGFIDIQRTPGMPVEPYWISGPLARKMVHQWRAVEPGILIGSTTAIKDNPQLTTRDWPGNSPLRVVIDPRGEVGGDCKVFDHAANTLVIGPVRPSVTGSHISYENIACDDTVVSKTLHALYTRGISSVLVEGGAYTILQFVQHNLWDEVRIFTGSKPFGDGVEAPEIPLIGKGGTLVVEEDSLLVGYNRSLVNKLKYLA